MITERGTQNKGNLGEVSWQGAEFPILCETCLGSNPYLRMTRADWDKECKICFRPFVVFRWKPGNNARFKKTEICQTCAKVKHVCQTCLLDLKFGLPVEIRDKFINKTIEIPKDPTNRDFWANNMAKNIDSMELPYDKEENYQSALSKLGSQSEDRKAQRNLPHICSFFVKGNCARGVNCPYRHELPKLDESLSDQNLLNRYMGIDDPVAKRIMKEFEDSRPPQAPADRNCASLYVGGITDDSVREVELQ